jgi:hypothetical protein
MFEISDKAAPWVLLLACSLFLISVITWWLLLLLIISAIFGFVFYFIFSLFKKLVKKLFGAAISDLKIIKGSVVLALLVLIFFSYKHIDASVHLKSLKKNFSQVARRKEPSYYATYSGDDGRGVDLWYGGSLDEIVRKRNDVLRQRHCVIIGKWWVTDSSVSTRAVLYLWFPFVKEEESS